MRVVHIITGLGMGGAEAQLRLLLRQLPACGDIHCDVITLTAPGAVAEGIRADGTRVTHLGMTGNRDLAALPRLVRLVRDGGYDVVHTHLYRACVYGRIAARLAGVRAVVATEHSLGEEFMEGRPLTPGVRALYLAVERLGTTTVAVSDSVAERLRRWGVPASRVCTVPNGIDAGRFRFDPAVRRAVRARLGVPEGAFVVAGVGRLVPGKQFGSLVEAVSALPDARLLLAGDGPERGALRAHAAALGAGERVTLLGECAGATGPVAEPVRAPVAEPLAGPVAESARGPVAEPLAGPVAESARGPVAEPLAGPVAESARGPVAEPLAGAAAGGGVDVPGVLAAADVFVSPSTEESFGLAVLEALAAGLPVLHVTCPAVDDLPPGQAPGARRVDPGPAALTAALRALHDEGAPRLPVPPVVHRYDIARSARELAAVYRAVTRRPPPAPGPLTAAPARTDPSSPHPSSTPTPSPLPLTTR